MTRSILPLTLAATLLLGAPSPTPAGSLSDFADELSGWVDEGLDRLRDEADRVARKRVTALEKVERLLSRDGEDLVQELGTARRVAAVLGRGFAEIDAEAARAQELVGELLDELDQRYDESAADALRGADALSDLVPGANRRATVALAIASDLALRADAVESDVRRARLLQRAARRVRRAAKRVRERGGVVGPYTCHASETGSAAGIVHLFSASLGALSATEVGGLLTVTSNEIVSTQRLDARAGGTALRLAFPPIAFDGVGAYEIGPEVGRARAEIEVDGQVFVARTGTLSVDAYDLDAKMLSGRLDIEVDRGAGPETVSGIFTICDILVVR